MKPKKYKPTYFDFVNSYNFFKKNPINGYIRITAWDIKSKE